MLTIKHPEVARIKIDGFECERCGHQWAPRKKTEYPTVCPKCKNAYWDKPKQTKATAEPAPGGGL